MKLTPSSTARRTTRLASSRSFGSPQIPRPVIRMAPKPSRYTGPRSIIDRVPLCCATVMSATTGPRAGLFQPPRAGQVPLHVGTGLGRQVLARGQQPGQQGALGQLGTEVEAHGDVVVGPGVGGEQVRPPVLPHPTAKGRGRYPWGRAGQPAPRAPPPALADPGLVH